MKIANQPNYHIQGRTREGLRFLRETRTNWTNDDVDYRQGSILEHRFQSHMWSLHLQVKQVEYGVGKLEDTLRREENIVNGDQDKWNTNQVSKNLPSIYKYGNIILVI